MKERAHPILYVIAALLAVNLGLTAWMFVRQVKSSAPVASTEHPLPAGLTKEKRTQLFNQIRARFNARDWAGLYESMDDFARGQVSKADAVGKLKKLGDLFGSILSGTYSHYEFEGSEGDRSFFTLYYDVTLSSAQFPQGQEKLTIMSEASGFGLVGFSIVPNAQ